MNRLTLLMFLFSSLLTSTAVAQEYGSAFRVGLNFSRFLAPSEKGANGNLEEFNSYTGFHVAGGMVFKLLENYGFKAEVMFSQVGGRYRYNGESFQVYQTPYAQNPIRSTGTRMTSLRVTNSYIELPVMGYAKLGTKLEFQLGASIGFLVSSTGVGTFRYQGIADLDGSVINEYAINLDYNFLKDDIISEDDLASGEIELIDPTVLTGVTLPATMKAYDMYQRKDSKFYKTMDFALIAGTSFYLSQGLFVGVSVNYGLLDTTNNFYDFSKKESNGLEPISRSDKDTNFSIRTSIGFSF